MQKFTGREYLKIDIANNFGLDKADWGDRIAWFDQNEHQLETLVQLADTPALYYAGVKAWRDVEAGKPTGYMISLDATSSGLQLLAALTGDRSASELCNVVDTGARRDAYTGIYGHMVAELGDVAKIDRDQCKDAVMTSLYGSTAMPKQVFGDGALLDLFYKTMKDLAPAAWDLNETFLAIWDPTATSHDWVLPDNYHVHIKVMNRVKTTVHFLNQPFEVFYNENLPTDSGRSLSANTIHSLDGMIVRELTRRCDFDPARVKRVRDIIEGTPVPAIVLTKKEQLHNDKTLAALWAHYKESNYLSARVLDYIDEDNINLLALKPVRDLLDSLPAKPFKVVSIHDCFRVLPNYGDDLRSQYNNQLMLIARSNILGSIISQLVGRRVQIGKLDPTLWVDIAKAEYALS